MLVTFRKRPPSISGHLSKTPKFFQSKAFSWNLLKQPPLVCDRATCGVWSLWSRYVHHYATQSMRKDLVTTWSYTYRYLEIVCNELLPKFDICKPLLKRDSISDHKIFAFWMVVYRRFYCIRKIFFVQWSSSFYLQFIQPQGQPPKTTLTLTIPPMDVNYLCPLTFYLRQNLHSLLHSPRYMDNNPNHHFRAVSGSKTEASGNTSAESCRLEPEIYLYNRPHSSGGKGFLFFYLFIFFLEGKVRVKWVCCINPLNPKVKIWILICYPYSFPTEVVGRSW